MNTNFLLYTDDFQLRKINFEDLMSDHNNPNSLVSKLTKSITSSFLEFLPETRIVKSCHNTNFTFDEKN